MDHLQHLVEAIVDDEKLDAIDHDHAVIGLLDETYHGVAQNAYVGRVDVHLSELIAQPDDGRLLQPPFLPHRGRILPGDAQPRNVVRDLIDEYVEGALGLLFLDQVA